MGVKEVMHYAKDAQREERGQVVQRNYLRHLGWRHQCQHLRPWCMIIVGVEARAVGRSAGNAQPAGGRRCKRHTH